MWTTSASSASAPCARRPRPYVHLVRLQLLLLLLVFGTDASGSVARQPPVEKPKAAPSVVAAPQSATMDAFMRMMTGKEERTIADRISDPNRPTWEQYKKDNADKLDLNDKGEKEMREYRRKLDAEREKVRKACEA